MGTEDLEGNKLGGFRTNKRRWAPHGVKTLHGFKEEKSTEGYYICRNHVCFREY